MTEPAGRLAELRDNLAAVQTRIGRACDAAGRSASDITLIAVTKFFPVTDAALPAQEHAWHLEQAGSFASANDGGPDRKHASAQRRVSRRSRC